MSRRGHTPTEEEKEVILDQVFKPLDCSVTEMPPLCVHCGQPATCKGAYEGSPLEEYACDECCGHGNEDGHCEPISEASLSENGQADSSAVAD